MVAGSDEVGLDSVSWVRHLRSGKEFWHFSCSTQIPSLPLFVSLTFISFSAGVNKVYCSGFRNLHQGWTTLALEIHFSAEFSLNPDQIYLPVVF